MLRSVITATAGGDTVVFAKAGVWVLNSALGAVGAALVLLGLPAIYATMSGRTGRVGVMLIGLGWMFHGVFLSLYSGLVVPWLADQAPSLLAATASPPAGFIIAFIAGLVAELTGSVLLAIPFIRGRVQPRWVGYILFASVILTVVGDFIIAPTGPASNVAVNLVSNVGPVLLLVALGYLGFQTWGMRAEPSIDHSSR
ncbi:hypothetical protein BH18VER1_BH18VER1_14080 [soil metagenome]